MPPPVGCLEDDSPAGEAGERDALTGNQPAVARRKCSAASAGDNAERPREKVENDPTFLVAFEQLVRSLRRHATVD